MCGRGCLCPPRALRSVPGMTLAFAADVDHIEIDGSFLSIALDLQTDVLADTDALEFVGEVRQPVNRLAVDADNHIRQPAAVGIGAAQPRALSRRSRND